MTYRVIARKWRPQTFAEIVGQRHVIQTLQNAIRERRVAHAYVFSGQRGVGKTTAARVLAKALNCERGPAVEPCNTCARCREIASGSSLDVLEIDAASNRGVDQIRELREMVRYAPAANRYRVVILDEAHQLTPEAFNALLKTLEEPPERVIFVLATTEPENLPETILSRAQHFHFRNLSFGEILQALERVVRGEGVQAEPGALAVLARLAEGSLRDALSLLEQAMAYCPQGVTETGVRELLGIAGAEALDELVEAIVSGSTAKVLELSHRLATAGQDAIAFCREAIWHFRNLLLIRACGSDSPLIEATADERPRLEQQAARFSEEDLTRLLQILLNTQAGLRRHPEPQVYLELGLLRMVNAGRLASLEEALAELRRVSPAPAPADPAPSESGGTQGSSRSASSNPTRAANPTASAASPASSDPLAALRDHLASQQKFLASLVEQATRWELAGDELRLFFPAEHRTLAEMLQAREPAEKLRRVASEVLGRPVRVCVTLESIRPVVAQAAFPQKPAPDAGGELPAMFQQNPAVRSLLERFGGRIASVKPAGGS